MSIREAEAQVPEYPSIERAIHALRGAPHGQVKNRRRKLVKKRLATLKRETGYSAASRNGKGR